MALDEDMRRVLTQVAAEKLADWEQIGSSLLTERMRLLKGALAALEEDTGGDRLQPIDVVTLLMCVAVFIVILLALPR